MIVRHWPALLWTGLWALLMAAAVTSRPVLPVDETRYVAVAWEMWLHGDFLVPHLNGEPYSHKPPLLFWLIHMGWAVFGVNEWWPRMVAPLFGLGTLFLIRRMAWRLWPDAGELSITAPLILFGCLFWTLFTTLTMFDMILAFCALVGLQGVLRAWRGDHLKGFALLGLGIGIGVLAKGPAILLHVLPAALLAPLWGKRLSAPPTGGWGRWYGGIAAALALGLVLALAWAIPAAVKGGEAYANAIFWGQSAGRMVDSFAHGRPWWWYVAVLAPMALPWVLWPALWRGSRGLGVASEDGGIRFCLSWFVPAFLVFSLISGKQLHYLLPIFPALALVIGFLLSKNAPQEQERPLDRALPGLFFAAFGAVVLMLPYLGDMVGLPSVISSLNVWWAIFPLAGGVITVVVPTTSTVARVATLSALSAVLVASLHVAAKPVLANAYDLKPLALRLAQWERQGYALAFFGKYHGQFHFLGRLEKRMTPIGLRTNDEKEWQQAFETGKVISYYSAVPTSATPDLVHKFRSGYLVVWDKQTVLDHPGIARRN